MEPTESKVDLRATRTIDLGQYQVVEAKPTHITIHLGRNITITIHTSGYTHGVKAGDMLSLFTRIPLHANPLTPPIQ